ncbi:MAG: hypothetical protein ACREQQ_04825, partial [Candidatus Binatia bacterium]
IQTGLSTVGPFRYCYRCTFRPWADSGRVISASATVNGEERPATPSGGAWTVSGLTSGDQVVVEPGDVKDEFGNVNGSPAAITVP